MRLNQKTKAPVFTHEGGPAVGRLKPIEQLRRSLLSCLLWEREFYEDGQSIAERIIAAAEACEPSEVAALAIEARSKFNLRHAPLLLLTALAKTASGSGFVSKAIAETIQRADELAEFVSVYWKVNAPKGKNKHAPLSAQVKKGLAEAFRKFDAYQLGKYDRAGAVRLRDVMFLTCPKPKDAEQAEVWKKLASNQLESPDTWEVNLSTGKDKRETWERLLREGKLGYLALLRNVRNMAESGVDMGLVRDAIIARQNGAKRVLPFRYIAAARACPQLEPAIDQALSEAISEIPVMAGKTAILVDVSGSMDEKLSARSDLTRLDAAAALASVIHGDVRVFTFSNQIAEVPPRRGMAGVDAIIRSQPHQGTYLGQAVGTVNAQVPHDRLIVITDEQSADRVPDPLCANPYMINVASAKNGVGYGKWTHIDGFSEQVIRFIHEHENTR